MEPAVLMKETLMEKKRLGTEDKNEWEKSRKKELALTREIDSPHTA